MNRPDPDRDDYPDAAELAADDADWARWYQQQADDAQRQAGAA